MFRVRRTDTGEVVKERETLSQAHITASNFAVGCRVPIEIVTSDDQLVGTVTFEPDAR